jgi:hypothetical protein
MYAIWRIFSMRRILILCAIFYLYVFKITANNEPIDHWVPIDRFIGTIAFVVIMMQLGNA